ncbi:MAG: flagellar basal body protein [Rhodothermales bacterium]|nr:flagellar basal body protein [Rhodothermales bacterium]
MKTPTLNLLSRAMTAYSWRLQAVAGNVANLDTPGYKRLSVSFEETLQEVRHAVPGPRDGTEVDPRVRAEDRPPLLEDELMEMADTQMRTQLASRALRHHFDRMRTGITGRSG